MATRKNLGRFIRRVLESEVVRGLCGQSRFADCPSNNTDPDVLILWSDRGYVSRVRKDSFREDEPAEISLFDFLFRWLSDMARDGVLAGPNWTGDLVAFCTIERLL